jgi:PAS domain S-box-containing protein
VRPENSLRSSQPPLEQLLPIIEASSDFLATADLNWRLTYLNPSGRRMIGLEPDDDVSTMRVGDYVPPEWQDFVRNTMIPSARDNGYWEGEMQILNLKTGRRIDVYRYTFLIRDRETGQPISYATVTRDISVSKQKERAVRDAEERLRLAQEAAALGSWIIETDTGRLQWGAGMNSLFGFPLDAAATQESWRSAVLPADLPLVDRALAATVQDGAPFEVEFRIRRRDEIRWLLGRGRLCSGEDGRLTRFVGANVDITERKLSESALRESEERFRATFENAAVGIAHVGLDGRWLKVNERLCEILGYSRDELLQLTFADVTHPEDLEEDWSQARAVLAGALQTYSMEKRYVRKQGTTVWVNITVSLMRDSAGKPVCFISIVEDISERKHAEEALRQSEERFRELADNMSQFAWMADSTGSLFWYNQRWYEYTGSNFEEMQGWGWQRVHHPDHVDRVSEKFRSAVREGKPWEDVFPLRSRMGEYRWFLSRALPIHDRQGAVIRWFGTNTDITEQLEAEKSLRESQEQFRQLNENLERRIEERTAQLASANRELEAFAYSVSHDLRAPLRAVDGYGRALVEDYEAILGEEGSRLIGRIRSATQRMSQLIEDLLNLSRVSRSEMTIAEVDLSKLAESIVRELRRSEPERQVKVSIAPHLVTRGDERLLGVVLENLLGNAWKFTSKTEEASIRFDRFRQDQKTVFRVCDNGAGFNMAYIDQLFAPFHRLHKESEFPGTGIGLATVQRIVHRHGGEVWAEAQKGHGATFYFTIG